MRVTSVCDVSVLLEALEIVFNVLETRFLLGSCH